MGEWFTNVLRGLTRKTRSLEGLTSGVCGCVGVWCGRGGRGLIQQAGVYALKNSTHCVPDL